VPTKHVNIGSTHQQDLKRYGGLKGGLLSTVKGDQRPKGPWNEQGLPKRGGVVGLWLFTLWGHTDRLGEPICVNREGQGCNLCQQDSSRFEKKHPRVEIGKAQARTVSPGNLREAGCKKKKG